MIYLLLAGAFVAGVLLTGQPVRPGGHIPHAGRTAGWFLLIAVVVVAITRGA